MVKNISSFGRNGTHDFIWVRVTAVLMTLYTIYLLAFFVSAPVITYEVWTGFWQATFNKVFTMLALLSILIHGWIGMWQVLTDYIKPPLLRASLQFFLVTVLFVYFFLGFFVVWGV